MLYIIFTFVKDHSILFLIMCMSLQVGWSWSYRCGCWESKLGPPEEQQVLITIEPSFQP